MKKITKNKILTGLIVLIGCLYLVSCSYLDVSEYIDDMTSADSVFVRKALLDKYIKGAASYLPNESKLYTVTSDPYQISSDENFVPWDDGRHAGTRFLQNELNTFTYDFANWGEYYKGIRKANIVIARIHECLDISEVDRRDYAGKAYFLRAYYYYLLLRQYGPIPIVPDVAFDSDETIGNMAIARSTYDECCDYICSNMQTASEMLVSKRSASSEIYQPSKGAALAVISRVRLEQASPWFNGNQAYSDWKTEDSQFFISQEYDNSKWGQAALAAKNVIDMGIYALHTIQRNSNTPPLPGNVSALAFPDGAGNIDPLRSYSELFNGETSIYSNTEVIYACDAWRGYGESVNWLVMPQQMGGANGLSLSQSLIDDYYMVDGRDITNSSVEYPYPSQSEEYQPIGTTTDALLNFSGYEIRPQTAKMYINREARFYATIGYCHSLWPGTSYLGNEQGYRNIEATYYKDGNCVPTANFPDDRCWSGYTLKKYTNPEDNLKGVNREKAHPIIRYAEILLNYVEALNELEGVYTDMESGLTISRDAKEICKYFNQIRYRAGLPGIKESDAADVAEMRELIKRERKIELACEHLRFFDLRRWGDASEELNKPFMGMNVEAKTNQRQLFYTRTPVNQKYARRSFIFKMNFFPIHRATLDKNPKLIQNPGW
ncbi:RagB/SusD family nutrient uptake outer membrane protein [Geofilum sp. OHC36d9]|uniref:RagB/SusD family nutrient uptake outer membrane protein n=1 Tax=Geofilum sp. OHC36d9 TaxID=3458413 RepID=UPI004033C605